MKNKLSILIFILILIIAIFNKLALVNFLYWRFWWFDIMMHFLGGLWIGLVSLWTYYFSGFFKNLNQKYSFIFLLSIISVCVIGIGWEIFEILIDPEYFQEGYISDTILDLIMDVIGGIISSVIIITYLKNNK